MLSKLFIQNYALIRELDVDFHEGMSVVTGETGAGKSIVLGALSLILGQRADAKALHDKDKKCIVEGTFEIGLYKLQPFFDEYDLDYDSKTMLRREIAVSGKSRAFINDTPVSLAQLKQLGTRLVDIHSQHETLSLNQAEQQLTLLDAFAGQQDKVKQYRILYHQFAEKQRELADLQEQESRSRADLDYFQFQLTELSEANLDKNEQSTLETELETLTHAEEIKSGVHQLLQGIAEDEQAIVPVMHQLQTLIQRLQGFHPGLPDLTDRLGSVGIELEDIAAELSGIQDSVSHDPNRAMQINDRLDQIYSLQQKHRVNSVEALLSLEESLAEKVDSIGSLAEELIRCEQELEQLRLELGVKASRLSQERKRVIPGLEKEVHTVLTELRMPDAFLKVEQEKMDEPGPHGHDKIQWLFSTNKGNAFLPLRKVASGGELSRLMLSIKSVLSGLVAMPTIIFDEIDTGVSGDVADRMGRVMQGMANNMQVISITHLPQIAGKGNHHYRVYKEEVDARTSSFLKQLDQSQRVEEIAKLLSGEEPSAAALENARELMSPSTP